MIIDIEPGARVEVPAAANYQIRMETSFTSGELGQVDTVIALPFRGFNGQAGEIEGQADDTAVLFLVTPDHFSPGEWTINPRLVVSGLTRRWPEAATLVVLDPLAPSGGSCGC